MESRLTAKPPLRKETGFVAFFDILGYGSLLEAGITEAAREVMATLTGLPQRLGEALKNHLASAFEDNTDLRREVERTVPLVVSDSILLRCSYDEDPDTSKRASQAATFLVAADVLERDMFERGLPLRGAIAFGSFIFQDNVFVGQPIIDGYRLGQNLDLAACVLHETAEAESKRLIEQSDQQWRGFLDDEGVGLVRYRAPVKQPGRPSSSLCLNLAWPPLDGCRPLKEHTDLRQFMHQRFWAHGKQIGPDALSKVDNTERFFRFLKSSRKYRPL